MSCTVKSFLGPNIQNLPKEDPIGLELMTKDHMVLSCNEGVGRVQVIDMMAQQVLDTAKKPSWQKEDGTIDLEALRKTITMTDQVAKKLLDEKGYLKFSDLHILDRESFNSMEGSSGHGSHPCFECRNHYSEVTFSRAIALIFAGQKDAYLKDFSSLFSADIKVVKREGTYAPLKIEEPKEILALIPNRIDSNQMLILLICGCALATIGMVGVSLGGVEKAKNYYQMLFLQPQSI